MIVNTEQLAEIFRTTTRTITNWVTEGLPVVHAGGAGRGDESVFNVGDSFRWLLAREIAKASAETPDARLRELQIEKLKMELDEKSRLLVAIADVESMLTEGIIAARRELLSLVDRLKGKLDTAYRVNIDPTLIETEVLQALDHIARFRPGADVEASGETSP